MDSLLRSKPSWEMTQNEAQQAVSELREQLDNVKIRNEILELRLESSKNHISKLEVQYQQRQQNHLARCRTEDWHLLNCVDDEV